MVGPGCLGLSPARDLARLRSFRTPGIVAFNRINDFSRAFGGTVSRTTMVSRPGPAGSRETSVVNALVGILPAALLLEPVFQLGKPGDCSRFVWENSEFAATVRERKRVIRPLNPSRGKIRIPAPAQTGGETSLRFLRVPGSLWRWHRNSLFPSVPRIGESISPVHRQPGIWFSTN